MRMWDHFLLFESFLNTTYFVCSFSHMFIPSRESSTIWVLYFTASLVSKYSSTWIVYQIDLKSYGIPVMLTDYYTETLSYGDTIIWIHHHMNSLLYGFAIIWIHYYIAFPSYGIPITWVFDFMNLVFCAFLDMWIFFVVVCHWYALSPTWDLHYVEYISCSLCLVEFYLLKRISLECIFSYI
jgi:hypothetical protein